MNFHVYSTPDEVISHLAEFFVKTVNKAIAASGTCSVVLSGGSSPKKLYELLAGDLYCKKADWSKVAFFFGDERYLPFTDPGNNGQMAAQALLIPLGIKDAQIYYINTSLSAAEAATSYANRIKAYFGSKPIQFDLTLLGLGDNVHTASLFPNTTVLHEMKALVKQVFVEEVNAWRITMTAPLINESKQIVFLVFGAAKAEAVYQVVKGERIIDLYPAQLIEPEEGQLQWFLDEAAAEKIR